ncbi:MULTISPECIES: NAD(P)/FAD-dependent oxidoreductase [Halocynthiibacter]|uniref:NAD(P)/FAD-dependent oxidoreductase n=1 Tax=Halocynthiibacter halioticoli TaxID=2986804 RepID=A0AAE3J134_9RHOB|nr:MULTISPECIES: NAD(P)/FAD-dependent oxidoreductase [Halocynthiibacter]MCV6825843.1 NAD(P)/FAD-dependent oxidoreductase [Halocynthiibacter halioticoli]MCW4058844.1 NAD(P)/FAD-dependent oxidoreductase [Halocynthiibacter sp. SDUM655004]
MNKQHPYHAIIIGAGAAGMMCAAEAAKSGGKVLLLDHSKSPGEKIRISGGGRCNFTNLYCSPENFISENPHFVKSALSRYSQWDFIDLVNRHNIAWHEKTLGQLFCDNSAKEIIALLLAEMKATGAELQLNAKVASVSHSNSLFHVNVDGRELAARNLVVATGGKSIPKMGATGFGYSVASQFGLSLVETRPALVPLTFGDDVKKELSDLPGVSVPARVTANKTGFSEGLLFTHRGLSGPSILQASSYWRETDPIEVQLLPEEDLFARLKDLRGEHGRKSLANGMAMLLPAKLAAYFSDKLKLHGNLADQSDKALREIVDTLTAWQLFPTGTEGYRTAEVTLGGVSTADLNSQSLECKTQPSLYFIGEVVDVTGWLGGFNFQWAWSSGWAAGTAISSKHEAK